MRTCIACLMLLATCSSAQGDLVIFNLGSSLSGLSVDEVASGSITVDGRIATLTANDGVLNATASNFGINASNSGDATDLLDNGSGISEFIAITFDSPVEITQLSLDSFSGAEKASVTVGINSPLFLSATTAGLDVYDFTSISLPLGNTLAVGQALVVGHAFGSIADNGFSLEGLRVNTVPEPSAVGLIWTMATGWVLLLRIRPKSNSSPSTSFFQSVRVSQIRNVFARFCIAGQQSRNTM